MIEVLKAKRELLRRKAQTSLLDAIRFNNLDYTAKDFHKFICKKLDAFIDKPGLKRLMLFMPPQHGKSEIASRHFPAYVLGRYPNTKIAAASYSIDLARSFNRDVQRIIDSTYYKDLFPNTKLNSKNVASDAKGSYLRNTEEFEIVNYKGYYKSVGVMGGLSGRSVDLAIIDDPVKDALEANSPTFRNRVWEWYINVLETRLHNNSKVVLIMTRWHEDDLAGRLLANQPEKWEVIRIPAIRDNNETYDGDKRKIGAPLWAEKHSLEKLLNIKSLSARSFEALYQQNPTIEDGDKIKRDWFEYIHEKELPTGLIYDLWIDGAYTKSTANDPSGLIICGYSERFNKLYIKHAHSAFMETPEFIKFVKEYASLHGLDHRSRVFFEPKATGLSVIPLINQQTRLNAVKIKGALVQQGKEARISTAAPKYESGKIIHVRGNWNEQYEAQLTGFPNAKHDEYVDLIGYASDHYFKINRLTGVRRRN